MFKKIKNIFNSNSKIKSNKKSSENDSAKRAKERLIKEKSRNLLLNSTK